MSENQDLCRVKFDSGVVLYTLGQHIADLEMSLMLAHIPAGQIGFNGDDGRFADLADMEGKPLEYIQPGLTVPGLGELVDFWVQVLA